jgi:oligo-1,6-glucosidase
MLATFILTMRGTPYYYNGDELGMTNAGFDKIEDFRDVQTLNEYKNQQASGGNLVEFMKRVQFESRDNARTPFHWDGTTNAGFTTGTPWIKVAPNYKEINAARQEKDPYSVLNYFRNMVKLRKSSPVLVYGKYTLLDKSNPSVYAYTRELGGQRMLVLLNFSANAATAETGINSSNARLLQYNYKTPPAGKKIQSTVRLRPYEALVYKL